MRIVRCIAYNIQCVDVHVDLYLCHIYLVTVVTKITSVKSSYVK